jgi:hypothetical protein
MDHLDARIADLATTLQSAVSSKRDPSEQSGLLAAAARSREDVRPSSEHDASYSCMVLHLTGYSVSICRHFLVGCRT